MVATTNGVRGEASDRCGRETIESLTELDFETTSDGTYGDLLRLSTLGKTPSKTLRRIPFGASSLKGGIDEETLRDLLFEHPNVLPTRAIDAVYAHPVAICRELSTGAGFVDAVYVNPLGRLILAEFKLWRNPQSRREVIGQILDYAKELASWSYEDLQREVSRSLDRTGNVLFELVRKVKPDLVESEFVDNVSRQLTRGEFLLLIVGDGIREGVENIVDFVQKYSGLHFSLALVEAALYRDCDEQIIVQPRCLARTEVVQRFVVESGIKEEISEVDSPAPASEYEVENRRFWSAVLDGFAFSDVTVEVPTVTSDATLFIKVRNSGFGDWGLTFSGYLYRNGPSLGCNLACRKGVEQAERVFEELHDEMESLQEELGEDLGHWINPAGRPRIGYYRSQQLPFPSVGDESFDIAVIWMRKHLDLLVSTLHPRLQKALRRY